MVTSAFLVIYRAMMTQWTLNYCWRTPDEATPCALLVNKLTVNVWVWWHPLTLSPKIFENHFLTTHKPNYGLTTIFGFSLPQFHFPLRSENCPTVASLPITISPRLTFWNWNQDHTKLNNLSAREALGAISGQFHYPFNHKPKWTDTSFIRRHSTIPFKVDTTSHNARVISIRFLVMPESLADVRDLSECRSEPN